MQLSTGTARHACRRVVTAVLTALLMTAGLWLTAPPAAAVTPGTGTLTDGVVTVAGTVAAVNGGAVTYDNTVPGTTTLTVSGTRTVIDLTSFSLAATDRLHVVVPRSEDIVLLRVATGAATVQGRLHATLGAAGGYAGNVWLLGPSGIDIAATAQVEAGGFLGVAGTITNTDALDGDLSFATTSTGLFTGVHVAAGSTTTGAVIRGHGGLVGLVAPRVSTALGTRIGAAPDSRTEVVIGSARNTSFTLGSRGDGLDLLTFTPSGSNQYGSVALAGTLTAADVFVSTLINPSTLDVVSTYTTGVTANGFAANGDGDVVVAGGGGLSRSSVSAALRPVLAPTAPAQIVATLGTARAGRDLVVSGSGPVELSYGTDLAAQTVAVSARGSLRNLEGSSAVNSALTQQWVVYAPQPSDVQHPNANSTNANVSGTLDSGQRAVWGGTLDTKPPSSVTGNRYVFSNPPDITVTAEDKAKDYDEAFAAGQATELTATVTGALHPGVPRLFLGDTGTLYTGAPALASVGAPHTAPERPGGYPIVPSLGTLASPVGYDFVHVNGTLDVDDTSPPTVTPNQTGAVGSNGWYTGNAGLSWAIVDPGTISSSITGVGCGSRSFTTDQQKTDYTCTGSSLGGDADPVTVTIGRDATPPTLTAASSIGGVAHPTGTWTNRDVRVDYTCSDATSGVAPGSPSPNVDPVTTTQTLTGTCTDNAGNTSTVNHQVNIDEVLPSVTDEALRLAGTDVEYEPGTWTNRDVELTWACTDDGGSGVVAGARSATTPVSGSLQGLCRDGAGNERSGSSFDVLIDTVDPSILEPTLTSGGDAYAPGDWARGPVTLTWGCADTGGSDPAELDGELTATVSGTLTATCTDAAGNQVTQSFDVKIDDQAPVLGDVALETADGNPYTSGDWTTQAVTLSWTCTDGAGQSGARAATGEQTATSTGGLRATCSDVAGNSVQGELFQANVDDEAPVLSGVPANQSLTTAGTSVTATWTAPTATDDQDASPEVSCTPASGSSFALGTTTVTCTATDHAGNADSDSFTVTVTQEAPVSVTFRAPIDAPPVINTSARNRVVPVRISATGVPVPTVQGTTPLALGAPQRVTCPTGARSDAVETYTSRWTTPTNLFYWDAAKRNWLAKLDTRGLVRNACYRVPVEHGGTITGGTATGGSEVGFFHLRTR